MLFGTILRYKCSINGQYVVVAFLCTSNRSHLTLFDSIRFTKRILLVFLSHHFVFKYKLYSSTSCIQVQTLYPMWQNWGTNTKILLFGVLYLNLVTFLIPFCLIRWLEECYWSAYCTILCSNTKTVINVTKLRYKHQNTSKYTNFRVLYLNLVKFNGNNNPFMVFVSL